MRIAMAIAAHPDDIEFFMSGTLILLRDAGYQIHYMNLANGCCGTTQYDVATIIRMRREEGMAAADLIGAIYHDSICRDLEIFYDQSTLAKLTTVVRQVGPEILLTHSPQDYMEDHINTSRLAVTAAFCRGMPNFPTDPPVEPIAGNVTIYHAQPHSHVDQLGAPVVPQLYVNVGDVLEQKVEMLSQHVSQKQWLDESQGMDSYLQTLRDLDRQLGAQSGTFEFAEGWRRHLHVGFCSPDDDPLSDALHDRIARPT